VINERKRKDEPLDNIYFKLLKMLDQNEALIHFHPAERLHEEMKLTTYGCRSWLLHQMGLDQVFLSFRVFMSVSKLNIGHHSV
jgi:hypothetical protein